MTARNDQQSYDHRRIEARWQTYWDHQKTFVATENPTQPKYYCLEMFPYPSGRIHMGHVRNYAIGDVIARYKRMRGFNVLHPMGWDAFGLPAENAAIAKGVHPHEWTTDNIGYMRNQLRQMGLSYDWTREITTCEPEYYRWNQWFFLNMYERGLAYRKRSAVNWCPSCDTVLANEQVVDGRCWRCDSVVVQKELEQWFFRITAYAEELLQGCDRLTNWPARVLTMQRNWVGKSEGVEVEFPLAEPLADVDAVGIFTTRPDTIFGATFMSLAPESPLVERLIAGRSEATAVREFVARVSQQDRLVRLAADREKEGVFTGAYAVNPFTKARIPIWVANFVLYEYGTGAIMAVPAHDQRDFEFAAKYRIPIKLVIQNPAKTLDAAHLGHAYEEQEAAACLVESGRFSGLSAPDAKSQIAQAIEAQGIGRRTIKYRLRDWGVSRQRYWGTPIPIIYCAVCGVVPVPASDLPVLLPTDVPFTGKGASPLAQATSFVEVRCPQCGRPARRETDTMDTFVDSSWYFLRYCSPHADQVPIDHEAAGYWMPVDQYIGGIEHAVLHLLYARFFTKVIRDLGFTKVDEPFHRLLTQGMVCKETYRCPVHEWVFPSEVLGSEKDGFHCAQCQRPVEKGRVEKMSKSKKNVVDPEHLIATYGADTARLFSLFAAPPDKDLEWSDSGVEGSYRFLNRVWRLMVDLQPALSRPAGTPEARAAVPAPVLELRRLTHRTMKKVTDDIEREFQFNTAIAALMEFVNGLYKFTAEREPVVQSEDTAALREAMHTLVLLLAPFAPHAAEELWAMLGGSPSVAGQSWPQYDPALIASDRLTIPIQVNGKLRSKIDVPVDWKEEQIKNCAKADPKVLEWIAGKTIAKEIYVVRKLLNLVVADQPATLKSTLSMEKRSADGGG
jgi:leucyl-tRNA synthetase